MNLQDRFYDKVMYEPMSGCWFWTGCVIKGGYGQIGVNGKTEFAHRISYTIHKGEIPKGLLVCHDCDQRSCVNPDHLFLGTHSDNAIDMVRKNRHDKVSKCKGEQSPNSRLKTSDILSIRALKKDGMRSKELALAYDVSERHIDLIVARKKWKHI